MDPLLIAIVVVVALAALFLVLYNSVVSMRQLTMNAWADVDVYLKRRAELVPNLVETVKAFASHEKAVLTSVVEARQLAMGSHKPDAAKGVAETELGGRISQVLILAESYPALTSSENFLSLQKELRETEKLIAHARQYFNACVRDYNTKLETFPSNLAAGMIGAKPMEFFQLSDASEGNVPRV